MRFLNNIPKPLRYALIGLFWLLVWQLISFAVNNDVLLCSPIAVLVTLAKDSITLDFWGTILFTFSRIALGFLFAFVAGIGFGALGWKFKTFATLFTPAILAMKSVPVVCFAVLLLIWFGSSFACAFAVFLVVFPAIYGSVSEGLSHQDKNLAEMLHVFRVPTSRKLLTFYWPAIQPFLTAACRVAVGMSWKSGVAAELIGIPFGSIGEKIYLSKILLSSADLFSWTIVIIIIALLCEKGFLELLKASGNWAWNAALPKTLIKIPFRRQGPARLGERVPRSAGSAIIIKNLSKAFGGNRVINNFSATFDVRERYAISAASGTGKTTLFRLIAGLMTPDFGVIRRPERISMVFQEARLFENRSSLDNMRLIAGDYLDEHEIHSLLLRVLPPESFDLPVSQLSGGMRRRLELCRALAVPSDVLLLDEPFAGLDAANRELAYDLIDANSNDCTVIITTHDLRDADALGAQIIALMPVVPEPDEFTLDEFSVDGFATGEFAIDGFSVDEFSVDGFATGGFAPIELTPEELASYGNDW